MVLRAISPRWPSVLSKDHTGADDKETVVLTSRNSKDFMLGGVPYKIAVVSTGNGVDGRFKIMIWQDPNKLEIFTMLTEMDLRRVG